MRPRIEPGAGGGNGVRGDGQRGYALLLTLFLLAIATTVGLVVVGNGVAARKLARSSSVALGVEERVALATWQALDGIAASGKAPVSQTGQVTAEGKAVDLVAMTEAGRIDLNGLSRKALAEAIQSLGFPERRSNEAADAIAQWRGMDPPGADGKNLTMNGRTALWSLEDLDDIAGLAPDIQSCLRVWGTVHARGPFVGTDALQKHDFATTGFGGGGGLIVGSMIRIVATDVMTGGRFRTIALYRGVSSRPMAKEDVPTPWLILEWLRAAGDGGGCSAGGAG